MIHCNATMLRRFALLAAATLIIAVAPLGLTTGTPPQQGTSKKRPTVEEARSRAQLLHEAFHATLQVVHLEYYREDESLKLPAATMKMVFSEMAKRHQVELRWLAVNAEAMNVEHLPRDEFEKRAVKALGSGKDQYETIEDGKYRLASSITLGSECLSCHAPNRTSNRDRFAGLIIAMPVRSE